MWLVSWLTAINIAVVWLIYHIAKAVYNLFFHPLKHVPGPLLARASYLPEMYYDLILFGRYGRRIEQMHKDFGPLVRINPNEVHCCDARFIDEIYASGSRKRDKPAHYLRQNGTVSISTFSTMDHDLHRLRRSATAKFFSRARVAQLEPTIHDLAKRACDKIIREGQASNDPFDVPTAYSLFTTDVISGYCFGESLGFVDQKGLSPNFRAPLYTQLQLVYCFRFFLHLTTAVLVIAGWAKFFSKDLAAVLKITQEDLPEKVRRTREAVHAGTGKGDTIFGTLLESDLPASEKSDERLSQEANTFFAGGTETGSWHLAVVTYHLLSKPSMLSKLTAEVTQALEPTGSVPSWSTLEKLPYLTSVIYEGLRLSYGVATRSSRVATGEDLVYRGSWNKNGSLQQVEYVIPRGYAVSMSAAIIHHDEEIFPDSHAFKPERWLDENNQHKKHLDHALLAFSKGSRACIGMNLAWCELYVFLALLTVRVFPRMRLYETTERDVAHDHEMFVSLPVAESKGVRAIIV